MTRIPAESGRCGAPTPSPNDQHIEEVDRL